jgi:8-oxo-dGTP pyrophosphatase MutT (NUDIX family)
MNHLDPQPWQTLTMRVAFQNRWLAVAIDEVALPTGQRYEYTRLEPRGIGVGVVGFNAAGEILLEREYRHGVGEVIWQLPGGLAAVDEDWQAAGLRELLEETGHAPTKVSAETVRYLGMVWDNPGFGPMCSHLYAAWEVTPVSETRRDPAEFVTLHWKSPEWLKEAVRTGAIKDRVVMAAVSYLLLNGWMA